MKITIADVISLDTSLAAKQSASSSLDSLAALDATAGYVYQTGANTFAKRAGIADTSTSEQIAVSDSQITVRNHIIPDTDIAYDLGSPTFRWRDIYVSANTIHLGDATQLSGTSIVVDAGGSANNLADIPTIQASKLVAKPYVYNPGGGNITVRPSIEFQVGVNSYPISLNTETFEFSLDAEGNYGTGSLVAKKVTLQNDTGTALDIIGTFDHDGNYTNLQTDKAFRFDGNATLGYDAAATLTVKSTSTFTAPATFQAAVNLGDGNDTVTVNTGGNNFIVTANNFTLDAAGNMSVIGNLTISGSTTVVNSNEVNIGDAIILLNSDISAGATPTENGGIQIARGEEAAAKFLWNETTDAWSPMGADIKAVGTLEATTIVGALTGNATTASALATARTINGVSFDGTANITIADSTKEPIIAAGTTGQYWRGDKTWQTLSKASVGLSNVDNTSDVDKPVSTAQQTALDLKLDSSTYTAADVFAKVLTQDGPGTGLNADLLDGQEASAFASASHAHVASNISDFDEAVDDRVAALIQAGTNVTITYDDVLGTLTFDVAGSSAATWGNITGTLGDQSDLVTALLSKEPTIAAGTTSQYWRGDKTWQTLDKSTVGLGSVDNTSDADKPISTATQSALDLKADQSGLDLKADLTGATFTGPISATNLSGTNTGDQTITLSGDVTGSGTGAITASITANAVTLGQMAQVSSGSFLGRDAVGTGNVEELTSTRATAMLDTATTSLKGLLSAGDKLKLDGISGGATANSSDAFLLNRTNHTGTQAWSTITSTPTTLAGYGITDAASSSHDHSGVYEPTIVGGTTSEYWRGDKTWQTLNKSAVGLSNVDNTSDANKPVSTATQTALDLKANISGASFTGPVLTTASVAGASGLRIPHGTAPTAPVNGDIWSTTANLFFRLNGTTRTIAHTGSSITGSAATLTTGRTIGMTGDVTWTSASFNGSANVTGTSTITDNSVTFAKMADLATARIVGRTSSGTGDPEALTGTQVTAMLDLATTSLSGLMSASDKTKLNGIASGATANSTDAYLLSRTNHTGTQGWSTISATPTTLAGYGITDALASSSKGAANGVATLDGNSKIPTSQLPALAITNTFVVANESAMLSAGAQEGDVVVRTDLSKTFIHNGGSAGTTADFQELLHPANGVSSVDGRTGTVTLSDLYLGIGANAASATKLNTARTISLSGDVTGSVSFDGSANVTISATVVDDSHSHIIGDVDGLQTALDAKLASSSYTAADVLSKLITVDGAGSGIDADLLDGQQGSYYAPASHTHNYISVNTGYNASNTLTSAAIPYGLSMVYQDNGAFSDGSWGNLVTVKSDATRGFQLSVADAGDNNIWFRNQSSNGTGWETAVKIWHSGNVGPSSGLDADTVDGLHASSFAQLSSAGTVFQGSMALVPSTTNQDASLRLTPNGSGFPILNMQDSSGNTALYLYGTANNAVYRSNSHTFRSTDNVTDTLKFDLTNLTYKGNTVWHAGNDGTGSGLDADTVDGYHHSAFVKISDTYLGSVGNISLDSVTDTAAEWSALPVGYSRMMNASIGTAGGLPESNHGYFTKLANRDTAGGWAGMFYKYGSGSSQALYIGQTTTSSTNATWDQVWTAGTDGSGSGLDADTVDGLQASSLVQTSGNQIINDTKTFAGTVMLNGSFGAAAVTDFNITSPAIGRAAYLTSGFQAANRPPTANYHSGLHFTHQVGSGDYSTQLVTGSDTDAKLYLRAKVNNNWGSWHEVWHSGNDGSGSGLDADTVDGVQASALVQTTGTQSVGGVKTFTDGLILNPSSNEGARVCGTSPFYAWYNEDQTTYLGNIMAVESSGLFRIINQVNNGSVNVETTGTGELRSNGNKVWHAGNDGAGSGLDADTVDGLQATSLVQTSGNQTVAGLKTITNGESLRLQADGSYISFYPTGGGTRRGYIQHDTGGIVLANETSGGTLRISSTNTVTINGNPIWHSGNLTEAKLARRVAYTNAGAGASTANYWARIGTITLNSGSYRDITLTLAISTSNSTFPSTGIISLTVRKSVEGNALSFNSTWLGGSIANPLTADSLKLVAASATSTIEVWVKKSVDYAGSWYIQELAQNANNASIAYEDNYVWQATEPTGTYTHTSGDFTFFGNKIWHAGNDGAGSGLDADTLDGIQGNAVITTSGGQTIAGQLNATTFLASSALATSASDGNGVRFWGGSTSYAIHMSAAGNGTYGGRVTGESTSDYNMYFKMTGGTNRGFVFQNGGTSVAGIDGAGNFRATGNITASGTVTGTSDIRLKDDIKPITGALELVSKMQGVEYTWKKTGKRDVGFIAQWHKEVAPEVVHVADDEEATHSVDYGHTTAYLVEAIKELKAIVEQQAEEIARLKEGK